MEAEEPEWPVEPEDPEEPEESQCKAGLAANIISKLSLSLSDCIESYELRSEVCGWDAY